MQLEEMKSTKNLQRFNSYIFYDFNGCWRWTNSLQDGYGSFWIRNKNFRAHVFSYLVFVGNIPDNLVVDHLCRVRDCVNPKHLDLKTVKENILCGVGIAAVNKQKTECVNGHEFTEDNTYITSQNHRHCITCRLVRKRKNNKTSVLGTGQYSKQKTHCKQGHLFTIENTYKYKGKYGESRGCKICRKNSKLKYKKGKDSSTE